MGEHLIDGEFQSDKFPTTPRGLVPLSCKDKSAQDLLWEYAERRRPKDEQFYLDLREALRLKGYNPDADRKKRLADKLASIAELLDSSVDEVKDLLLQEMEAELGEFEEQDANRFPKAEEYRFVVGCEPEEKGEQLVALRITCNDGEAKRLRSTLDALIKIGEDVVQLTVSGCLSKGTEDG